MNTRLENIFEQARESEPDLAPDQFTSGLHTELRLQQLSGRSKFDWLLVVAAVMASCAVFFLTPAFSLLVALPENLMAANLRQALPLVIAWVSTLVFISLFVYSELEPS